MENAENANTEERIKQRTESIGIYSWWLEKYRKMTWAQLMSSFALNCRPLITIPISRNYLLKSVGAIFHIECFGTSVNFSFHLWPNVSFISHPYFVGAVSCVCMSVFFSLLSTSSLLSLELKRFYSPWHRWNKLRQWRTKAFGHKISFHCEHCVTCKMYNFAFAQTRELPILAEHWLGGAVLCQHRDAMAEK